MSIKSISLCQYFGHVLIVWDNMHQDMIRSMLYHNSHMFLHRKHSILDSLNIEHLILSNYNNLEAFHETKIESIQSINLQSKSYPTRRISRMIITIIKISINEQRIITKIYGGANARFPLLRLPTPPGKNVLG